jgi:hypothetical protein
MVGRLARTYRRELPGNGVFRGRCSMITGQRGVGKTTLMIQYLQAGYPDYEVSRRCLYLPADHFLVAKEPLYAVAEAFANQGGCLLCVDEIHKADYWSRDLKSILDTFPDLAVVVTGSSLLHLERGSHDLSRRVLLQPLAGLSFREFLELRHGVRLPRPGLDELVGSHEMLVAEIGGLLRPRKLFVGYFGGCRAHSRAAALRRVDAIHGQARPHLSGGSQPRLCAGRAGESRPWNPAGNLLRTHAGRASRGAGGARCGLSRQRPHALRGWWQNQGQRANRREKGRLPCT